ncbi:hypothetical protein [Hydrogenimonas urashimensis]|uniref:hypothetical protein n=1 Tax=Hydrogenimonas urashimensis TaxID=2740515 RepID=UPI0019158B9E|nr:hypothetical protein [Hydrogenimonas urashimensis]
MTRWARTIVYTILALSLFGGCGSKEPLPAYKNKDAQYQQKQAHDALDSLDREFSK